MLPLDSAMARRVCHARTGAPFFFVVESHFRVIPGFGTTANPYLYPFVAEKNN